MQLNVILADDLLPLKKIKNHRALAVSQLSRCLINLQVKCICSATHPPRSWLCCYDTGYGCAGRARKRLIEEGKRLGEPASRRLQRAFHSERHCFVTSYAVISVPQQAYFGASAIELHCYLICVHKLRTHTHGCVFSCLFCQKK